MLKKSFSKLVLVAFAGFTFSVSAEDTVKKEVTTETITTQQDTRTDASKADAGSTKSNSATDAMKPNGNPETKPAEGFFNSIQTKAEAWLPTSVTNFCQENPTLVKVSAATAVVAAVGYFFLVSKTGRSLIGLENEEEDDWNK